MDRFFNYSLRSMIRHLQSVEGEMREDSYPYVEASGEVRTISSDAFACIRILCGYMKTHYLKSECTLLVLMQELYLVAVTGEYTHLQSFEDIGTREEAFEKLKGESGYDIFLYGIRLLRYYGLVFEKRYLSASEWSSIQELCRKAEKMGALRKLEKRERRYKESGKDGLTEEDFMKALWDHMERNYIGQELLKKKLCSVISQWLFHSVRTNLLMVGPSGSGKNYMIETIRSFPELHVPVVSFDCSSLTPNGFTGADARDIFRRVRRTQELFRMQQSNGRQDDQRCIVFLDEIDKIINFNHDARGESVNAMIQQQLLSTLAGTETIEEIDTSNILFILGGAFPRIADLKKEKKRHPMGFGRNSTDHFVELKDTLRDQIIAIGGEVEFVGRIEEIVELSKLTREDLRAILMDENIGEFTRKKRIYREAGIDLEIDEDAVEAIVDLIEKEDAGARSVRNIMNQFADSQYFFDLKMGGYDRMIIHSGMLAGEGPSFGRGGEVALDGKSHRHSKKK